MPFWLETRGKVYPTLATTKEEDSTVKKGQSWDPYLFWKCVLLKQKRKHSDTKQHNIKLVTESSAAQLSQLTLFTMIGKDSICIQDIISEYSSNLQCPVWMLEIFQYSIS